MGLKTTVSGVSGQFKIINIPAKTSGEAMGEDREKSNSAIFLENLSVEVIRPADLKKHICFSL